MLSSDLVPSLTGISIDARRVSKEAFRGIDFRGYLQEAMAVFSEPLPRCAEPITADLPERIFDVLTSREYCYLSSARVAPYREEILGFISTAVAKVEPIRFYFDIGGGYHATLEPGVAKLCFDVGLAELMILRQIRSFVATVSQLYGPGAVFTLVIDNMCAALINDVPLEHTKSYVHKLRTLIHETGMEGLVDLLVESERFTEADFARVRLAAAPAPGGDVSTKQHENVERFLGRRCDSTEAAERTRLYTEVTTASEKLLNTIIDSVHMTQRASATTICFRPFPGGDSRIQAGEVALLADGSKKVRPILLTSRNINEYSWQRETPHACLPRSVPHVTYARPFIG
jgi:hypothetical protein